MMAEHVESEPSLPASQSDYMPATVEERGVVVAFTTPLLNQARVRLTPQQRFEFLLPNFTAGKGIYVLGWKGLGGIMTLTLHDRLLFQNIETLKHHVPEAVRHASLSVQSSGICGPDAANAAAKTLDDEQQELVLAQFVLVTELLKLVNIQATDLLRPGMTADDSNRVARQSLAKVAQMLGIAHDDLTTRVDRLGERLAPLGLPQSPRPGRLRRLATQIEHFADEVEAWASSDLSDASTLGDHCVSVARHTLRLAQRRVARIDEMCSNVRSLVEHVDQHRPLVDKQIERISWLLDGWEFLTARWKTAEDEATSERQTLVSEISRLIPPLTKDETNAIPDIPDMDTVTKLQRRWVQPHEDWRTGALDMLAVRRLETVKASIRAASAKDAAS
jgi:hypothetical protein